MKKLVTITIILMIMLSGCSKKSPLIGEWALSDYDKVLNLSFSDDNTVYLTNWYFNEPEISKQQEFKYEWIDGDKLNICDSLTNTADIICGIAIYQDKDNVILCTVFKLKDELATGEDDYLALISVDDNDEYLVYYNSNQVDLKDLSKAPFPCTNEALAYHDWFLTIEDYDYKE
jgi:hypothetical protein